MNQSIYIEYANLSPENIKWLDGCGAKWANGLPFKYTKTYYTYLVLTEKGLIHSLSAEPYLGAHPYTHIPTGNEFCDRVAEILRIEKPVFGELLDIEDAIDLSKPDSLYPHKIYRILDSLDGVPFDTRIPLSEWIPPFGAEVVFITNNEIIPGHVKSMGYNHCNVWIKMNKEEYISLDCHWMRIV